MVNTTCLLKALLSFLLILTGGADFFFYIFKAGYYHDTGVLLGGFNSSEGVGNICRKYNSTELTPNKTSADIICQIGIYNYGVTITGFTDPIRYHRALWIKNAGVEYPFPYYGALPVTMRDVVCWWEADGPKCSYNKGTDCEGYYYYTAISCGCNKNYYRNDTGCFKCLSNSTSDGSTSTCGCEAGYYWGYNQWSKQYDCLPCGHDEYSKKNSTACTSCPKGTSTFNKQGQTSCSNCNSESGFSIYVMGLCLYWFTILYCCIGILLIVLIILSLSVIGRRCYRIKQLQACQRERDEQEQQRQQYEELRRRLALFAESKPKELAIKINDLLIENKVTEDSKSHNHNQETLPLQRSSYVGYKGLCVLDGRSEPVYIDDKGRR